MAAILADDIFNCILLNENDKIPNQISLKLIPMARNRRQAITWTNDDPVHWRIYAALGGDELDKKHCNIGEELCVTANIFNSTKAWSPPQNLCYVTIVR